MTSKPVQNGDKVGKEAAGDEPDKEQDLTESALQEI